MRTVTPFGTHRASGNPVSTGSLLVLLLLVFSSSILCCCDAFAPRPSSTVTFGTIRPPEQLHHLSTPPGQRLVPIRVSHALFQQIKDDDNEETTQANLNDTPDSSGKKEPSVKKKPSSFGGLKRITFVVSRVFSYSIITLGTLLSFGLLLNICGYSYQVTDHGIVVDTLENMRMDQQFRSAVVESMQDIQQ
jgi:hypothetical protein